MRQRFPTAVRLWQVVDWLLEPSNPQTPGPLRSAAQGMLVCTFLRPTGIFAF